MSFNFKPHYIAALCMAAAALFFTFCKSKQTSKNKFSDPEIVKIEEQRFNYWRTHLMNSLEYKNPVYKAEAIMAIASMKDATPFKKITGFLTRDESPKVRAASALYLGVINGRSAVSLLCKAIQTEKDPSVKKQILLALAKSVGPNETSVILGEFSDPHPEVREACYLSLIQIIKRGIQQPGVMAMAVDAVKSEMESTSVRWFASYALSVSDSLSLIPVAEKIKVILNQGADTLSANLLTALAKVNNREHIGIFLQYFTSGTWRERVASLHGLKKLHFPGKNEIFLRALFDNTSSVRLSASEILRYNRDMFTNFDFLATAMVPNIDWSVRLDLLEAEYKQQRSNETMKHIKKIYDASTNPFEKARCIELLGRDPENFRFIVSGLWNSKPPIKASFAWAIVKLDAQGNLLVSDSVLTNIYKKGISTGDPALATIFGNAFLIRKRITSQDAACLLKSYQYFLTKQNYEVASIIKQAMSLGGQYSSSDVPQPTYLAPDWDFIRTIDKDQRVKITTTKGDIVVRLLVDDAPVAVSNFLKLVDEKYYDNTYIYHSSVVGLLAGGCKRGDGYGKKDYVLPFETPSTVRTQPILTVNRTAYFESTQWNILTNPLSGRQENTIIIGIIEMPSEALAQARVGDLIISIKRL